MTKSTQKREVGATTDGPPAMGAFSVFEQAAFYQLVDQPLLLFVLIL